LLLVLPLAPGVPAAAAADATVLSLMLLPAVCSRFSCMLLLGPATEERSLAASIDARLLNLPSSAAPAAAWLGCCRQKQTSSNGHRETPLKHGHHRSWG
jgi:hypothetical protein